MTDHPHELKIVNRKNEDQVYVWVATCSQANLISAVGEHRAIFMGYAQGQTSVDTSVQKYNCHKVNEFVVGTSSKLNGEVDKFTFELFKTLLDTSA